MAGKSHHNKLNRYDLSVIKALKLIIKPKKFII